MIIKKRLRINSKNISADMKLWFSVISLLGICVTLIAFFAAHGKLFSGVFFTDGLDTGMDFFHSIEYTRGRSPYELFNTLYPPLANLLFYILYRLVPLEQSKQWAATFSGGVKARGTGIDLRLYQPTLMLFILFIAVSAVLLALMVQVVLKHESKSAVVALLMVLAYSTLYAFERGNIIILSAIGCMFFVQYRNSENKIMSELALIVLALSAGLKIYPAVFGILLIYDKQYAKAGRTVLYGLMSFILPLFVFHGGLGNIDHVINNVLSFGGTGSRISSSGYSLTEILNTVVILLRHFFGLDVNEDIWLTIIMWIGKVLAVFMLVLGFFIKENWKKTLACTLAILLYQSQGIYILTFMLIPLVFMMREEQKMNKKNIIPYLSLVFMQVLLPLHDLSNPIISIKYIRFQICMVLLIGWFFASTIRFKGNIISRRSKRKELK